MLNKDFCVPVSELASKLASSMDDATLKMATIEMEVADRIRKERKKKKMNQSQFADFMNVSQAMISKWESGEYNFTICQIVKIFDKLGIDVDLAYGNAFEYAQPSELGFKLIKDSEKKSRLPADVIARIISENRKKEAIA